MFEVPLIVSGDTFAGSTNLSNFTYSFEQGLEVSGTNTFGSATYIFSTSTNGGSLLNVDNHSTITAGANAASAGVLFYLSGTAAGTTTPLTNGTVTVGNGFGGTFYSPPSGPYEGIVWWDASCGNWQFQSGVGGGSGPDFTGGIYVPCALMTGNGNFSYEATFMVINSLSTNGSTGTIQ